MTGKMLFYIGRCEAKKQRSQTLRKLRMLIQGWGEPAAAVTTRPQQRLTPHQTGQVKPHGQAEFKKKKEKKKTQKKRSRYLMRFFVINSEHQFVRINTICESKHRAEVALELRDGFDFRQNLRVHSFLINLALLCNLVFLKKEKTI